MNRGPAEKNTASFEKYQFADGKFPLRTGKCKNN